VRAALRSTLASVLSLTLHGAPVLGVYLVQRSTEPRDASLEQSAGWDAWGIDVALEPSEGAEASAGEAQPNPAATEAVADGDAHGAERGSISEASEHGVATPRPTAPRRARRPTTVAARASAPGRGGPLADSNMPASSSPGIGSAERSSLLKDFVWVVSSVNSRDDAWHQLPRGPAGKLRLRLTLNVDGRIVSGAVLGSPPEHLARLWGRTRLVLERGRFAPRPDSPTAEGHLDLTLEARILDEPPEATDTSDPLTPVAYSQTPPSHDRPGRAYFRFPSGRAVEILVRESDDRSR
jgi:hypothetical protein